jgi:hypothetical protein
MLSNAALLAALAGCSASGKAPGPSKPNSAAGGAAGAPALGGGGLGSSGASSSAAGTTSTAIGIDALTKTCAASELGRPQLRRLTRSELQRTLDDVFPQVKGKWSVAISSEVKSSLGFENDPALLTIGSQVASQLLDTATSLATVVTAPDTLPALLPCSTSAADHTCAQTFLSQYGRRLFRRPLAQPDLDRYLGYFDARLAASDFPSALRWMLTGLIQSPHAIYRREIGANQNGEYQLSQYEIATELAYTFTGTTPSSDLLAQADAGQLQTPAQLLAAASQMLASPAGQEVVQQFFRSWLGYDQVPSTLANFSDFASVSADMVQETQTFLQAVVLTGRGGAKDLLTAPFTTPSTALASLYGFPAPATNFAKVTRPAGRGLGVLAQASLIAAHSHETASSPTLRGLLVFERFLCGTRPQVPPNVPTLVPPSPGQKTTRQRYEEQHMAAGTSCPTCHKLFDPLGFGFEHYNEAGRYRDLDSGLPINSSGQLAIGGQMLPFAGLDDLATDLASQDSVGVCVSGYINAYAFANPTACLGETRRSEFVKGTLGFVDYLASLAAEPSFTRRK